QPLRPGGDRPAGPPGRGSAGPPAVGRAGGAVGPDRHRAWPALVPRPGRARAGQDTWLRGGGRGALDRRVPRPLPPAGGGGRAPLAAGRRAQAALPRAALPLERIRVIAAALAAGDELRLEPHPAAVTAAGRSLGPDLGACLP